MPLRDDSAPHQIRILAKPRGIETTGLGVIVTCVCLQRALAFARPSRAAQLALEGRCTTSHEDSMAMYRKHLEETGAEVKEA